MARDRQGNQQLIPKTFLTLLPSAVRPMSGASSLPVTPDRSYINNGVFPQAPPPTSASTNHVAENQNVPLSRVKRSRSTRRRTAEIQTTWEQDPEYQRDTVESTQANLHQDYNFLYHLVKVSEAATDR